MHKERRVHSSIQRRTIIQRRRWKEIWRSWCKQNTTLFFPFWIQDEAVLVCLSAVPFHILVLIDYFVNQVSAFLHAVGIFLLIHSKFQFLMVASSQFAHLSYPVIFWPYFETLYSGIMSTPRKYKGLYWKLKLKQAKPQFVLSYMHGTRESFVMFTSCCLINSTFTSSHDQMVFISFECDNIPATWRKPVSTGQPGGQLIDNALWVTHLPHLSPLWIYPSHF